MGVNWPEGVEIRERPPPKPRGRRTYERGAGVCGVLKGAGESANMELGRLIKEGGKSEFSACSGKGVLRFEEGGKRRRGTTG